MTEPETLTITIQGELLDQLIEHSEVDGLSSVERTERLTMMAHMVMGAGVHLLTERMWQWKPAGNCYACHRPIVVDDEGKYGHSHLGRMINIGCRAASFIYLNGTWDDSFDRRQTAYPEPPQNQGTAPPCSCGDPSRKHINHRKSIPCWTYVGYNRVDVGTDGKPLHG